ncbi:hypothetical protein LY78DRAFT_858 [Colletotrichum sublineola]|nr:hypothetical protein LY78DRAFT_858 [Colletotrichum sublineola]
MSDEGRVTYVVMHGGTSRTSESQRAVHRVRKIHTHIEREREREEAEVRHRLMQVLGIVHTHVSGIFLANLTSQVLGRRRWLCGCGAAMLPLTLFPIAHTHTHTTHTHTHTHTHTQTQATYSTGLKIGRRGLKWRDVSAREVPSDFPYREKRLEKEGEVW